MQKESPDEIGRLTERISTRGSVKSREDVTKNNDFHVKKLQRSRWLRGRDSPAVVAAAPQRRQELDF